MPALIVLDTGPLSNCVVRVSHRPDTPPTPSEACRQWLTACERNGATILVPAIAYYECLREIERRQAASQKQRLREYCFQAERFVPLTTAHLELAAQLWGKARISGNPTAQDGALDGDTILCAQVLSLGLEPADYVVATTNTKHLAPLVPAMEWWAITP